ncbi:hypothetical protein KIPB_012936 [Kipferlia bialata]|uniref:Ribosome production factor 2 homolog n=1 Tax=Kipferlia bialata TaxID=797122 RepID=A0A391NVJ7_9EUKA|nr:hypothetical protein KIPB_012936 [Kipferlia bialata]|eukprot:g12936.t1
MSEPRIATTQRGKRALKAKESQIFENAKNTLFLYGKQVNDIVKEAMVELFKLKRSCSTKLQRRNDISPFNDSESLEFLMEKNDCSLFVLGNHQKKRPHNLIFGRTFNGRVLDMCEYRLTGFQPSEFFERKAPMNLKPMIAFKGDFDSTPELVTSKSILSDLLRNQTHDQIAIESLRLLVTVTVVASKRTLDNGELEPPTIYIRPYIVESKGGCMCPYSCSTL